MELQLVELHYSRQPSLDLPAVRRRVEELTGNPVDTAGAGPTDTSHIIYHTEQMITYADGGKMPAQTVISSLPKKFHLADYAEDLQQSWSTPNAAELLEGSTYTLAVLEMMARALEPAKRLSTFHAVLQSLVEMTDPRAIVFKHSQQVIDPATYLQHVDDPPLFRAGSLNVRFFNVGGRDEEFVMDTRGLQEIGLHDLQCHFRRLEPNDVAKLLMNTSAYLLDNGRVIDSGNTIQGILEGSKWVCQFEESLAPPRREVLDINPGEPFAGGNR